MNIITVFSPGFCVTNFCCYCRSFQSCTNPNCQYSTCCAAALDTHTTMCRNLHESLPLQPLPYKMYCVCGYSDTDGQLNCTHIKPAKYNDCLFSTGMTLAKHLAICERKSAYPSEEKAKAATVTHSMLDVLGLMRRPEEPATVEKESEEICEKDDGVNDDAVVNDKEDVAEDVEMRSEDESQQDDASQQDDVSQQDDTSQQEEERMDEVVEEKKTDADEGEEVNQTAESEAVIENENSIENECSAVSEKSVTDDVVSEDVQESES